MSETVHELNIKREPGYLYFIDKDGDVSRSQMSRGATRTSGSKKVATAKLQKESGYLYFLDKAGNICRTPMSRGRSK